MNELRGRIWNGGQIMAFSALDGVTDYSNALTARTAFDLPGIGIMIPGRCHIRFPEMTKADNIVAGDWFRLGDKDPTVGVFLDTHHLLVDLAYAGGNTATTRPIKADAGDDLQRA